MSQSASSADAPASPTAIDDGPVYPVEGKFSSTDDRDHILGLPEIERESILAERAQVALKQQQDLQLKKALAASQAAASKHKRKAAAADLEDDGQRKTSRPKTEKASALDSYKKAREAKGAERSSRFDSKRDRRDELRSPSRTSDRDADGESEVEWAEPSSDSRRNRFDEPPAELRDFERCRIGRSNFAKISFYPNFENAMKGCFTRVSIGVNRETGQNMYRMTQIKGVFSPSRRHDIFFTPCTSDANQSYRLHRRQTLPTRATQRQDLLYRPIRACLARQRREAVAFQRLLRLSSHSAGVRPLPRNAREGARPPPEGRVAASETGRYSSVLERRVDGRGAAGEVRKAEGDGEEAGSGECCEGEEGGDFEEKD